jgi:hypothetical protein
MSSDVPLSAIPRIISEKYISTPTGRSPSGETAWLDDIVGSSALMSVQTLDPDPFGNSHEARSLLPYQ